MLAIAVSLPTLASASPPPTAGQAVSEKSQWEAPSCEVAAQAARARRPLYLCAPSAAGALRDHVRS